MKLVWCFLLDLAYGAVFFVVVVLIRIEFFLDHVISPREYYCFFIFLFIFLLMFF